MYTGQVAVISNKATYLSDLRELVDEDDGTTEDLTNPVNTVDVVVTIRDLTGCILITASLANGKVTIPGPGYQYQLEASDLSCLCAGTYRVGERVTINNFITDLIDGTIAVIEGI